jgi:hypothetical protein
MDFLGLSESLIIINFLDEPIKDSHHKSKKTI